MTVYFKGIEFYSTQLLKITVTCIFYTAYKNCYFYLCKCDPILEI